MTTKTKSQEVRKLPPLTIENAHIMWRNFEGAAKKFNAKGLRNFHVRLETPVAQKLEADGWNVRWHDPKEEGDEAWASIKVAVRFDNYPPRIVLITGKNKKGTLIDEDTVYILDTAEIENVDLKLTASPWSVQGKSGYKAYLSKMFVTLSESDLESKYMTAMIKNDHYKEVEQED